MGALWFLAHAHGGQVVESDRWSLVVVALIAAAACWYAGKQHRKARK